MRPTARARVDQIIHMKRELVQLEGGVDLGWLDDNRSLDVSSAGRRAFSIWLRSEGRPAIEGSRQGGAGGNRAIKRAAVGATAETRHSCQKLSHLLFENGDSVRYRGLTDLV